MRKQEFSTLKLVEQLRTEADAYLMLEGLRWGAGKPVCPHCGAEGEHYFLKPSNGTSRATRTGSLSQRRVWKCREKGCRKQFSVLTNTIFHGTKIPIRTWLLVIFDVASAKNSVSAWEIARKYDMTNESAWHMLHRLREAMKREPVASLLSGTVAADETWIGGKAGNQSNKQRAPRKGWNGTRIKTDKPAVLALVDTTTGEVRSRVIPDVKGTTLRGAIAEHVELGATTLVTDEWNGYKLFRGDMKAHETVNHSRDEYVNRDGFSTNATEGYFAQLKRSLDGTHHHVSREHLARYLAQFDWLYTHCKATDSQRMRHLIGNAGGRRLTYKPLTGDA